MWFVYYSENKVSKGNKYILKDNGNLGKNRI